MGGPAELSSVLRKASKSNAPSMSPLSSGAKSRLNGAFCRAALVSSTALERPERGHWVGGMG